MPTTAAADASTRMRLPAQCWLTDMDGVLRARSTPRSGAAEFCPLT